MRTRKDRESVVGDWLLGAAPDLDEARTEWATTGIALLRCGGAFTAVRIQADIVQAAAGTEDPERVDAFLAEALHGGPVFIDRSSRRYYALVPASTSRLPQWAGCAVPGAECLGSGCFLGVPCLQRTEPEESRCYWCVPMSGPGALCSPDAVSQLVAYGRFRRAHREHLVAEADEDGHGQDDRG
ncbi:hypothetical protein AB0L71_21090 [Streptomyces sp. NPDC052052]|uniref:hypothetical protein n=1 Tax=Streptomyces sp. NPDC052052 TaxID=3154756 RepID=UPI003429CF71